MRIKEFEYLDIVINQLNTAYPELNLVSQKIEEIIFNALEESKLEFSNVSSRVKSPDSLREKILRNKYYKKFEDPTTLIYNLSDLIGVRIECRFSDDEKNIYRYLKKYFNKKFTGFYFYNEENPNLFIKFQGKQPQKQKNGFTIYRIDGKYIWNDIEIPFELQIKSLVNMFWGEIEHQIIYKNSNYIIEDKFLKDIMGSIKNNLSMIDKQLLTVFNHFESKKRTDSTSRKKHLEDIVSKMVYDVFSHKMNKSIGMVIDFKNSCETIIRYTFSINTEWSDSEYTKIMINALNRIDEISTEEIDFNSTIKFERSIYYKDEFSKILGAYFEEAINTEFNWNLFFRILFTLEPLNNVRDFEKFLDFLRDSYTVSPNILEYKSILEERFNDDFASIESKLLLQVANSLVNIDKIDIVFDYNIVEVNELLENFYKYIIDNISTISILDQTIDELLLILDDDIRNIF